MKDLSGLTIGRYHIIENLGEGGMAIVYKAYDTHLECEVAVKMIRTDQLAPNALDRALKRFEREAKKVAKLNHPNIVKVSDYGEFEGNPYLVMPYLPGGTLKGFIKNRGQILWQEATQLLIPIADALAYAHSENIIHRDIKPSNILLTQTGQPMLTDFGVAKIIDEDLTQDLTGPSVTVGTPEYMAPEQVTSKMVDQRADIYSLGVVFYEMITGRTPFKADTPMAVLIKLASDPLPRPSLFVKDLPADVEHILIKALAKKPEDRYQKMTLLLFALKEVIIGKENRAINKVWKMVHIKWLPIVISSIALLAVVTAGIGLFKYWQHGPGSRVSLLNQTQTIASMLTTTVIATGTPVPSQTPTPTSQDKMTLSVTNQKTPSASPTQTPKPTATTTAKIFLTPTGRTLPNTYTMQLGEFHFCIARRFNVSISELLSINGLSMDSNFYAGQVLQIPQTGNPFEGTRALHEHPTTYKVQSGDTIHTIACYFGDVFPEDIATANRLLSPYNLEAGDVLQIP